MKRRVAWILAVVVFLIAFFPVRLEMQCTSGPPGEVPFEGGCSKAGESLIGITISSGVMGAGGGLLFVLVLLAPFLYVGYRMDRHQRKRAYGAKPEERHGI